MVRAEESGRRFKFESTSQKVKAIRIDSNAEVNGILLPDAECFTEQACQHWQELCCAHDYNSFIRQMRGKYQTLPQIILHQRELVDAILSRLHYKAAVSVPALLGVLSALAQDLGEDFLVYFSRTVESMASLVNEGAFEDSEVLEVIFDCLARLCKLCRKQFLANHSKLFAYTSMLRLHKCRIVRSLAAKTLGFSLRSATIGSWGDVYLDLIAEIAATTRGLKFQMEISVETGELIYQCFVGIGNEIHSKALDRIEDMLTRAVLCDDMNIEIHAIHSTVIMTTMKEVLQHSQSGQCMPRIWDMIHELLHAIIATMGESTSHLVTLQLSRVCVQYFTQPYQVDKILQVFNHLVARTSKFELTSSESVLAARRDFLSELFTFVFSSKLVGSPHTVIPSLHSIPWTVLISQDKPEETIRFLSSLYSSYTQATELADQHILLQAFVAARDSVSKLGKSSVQLMRKLLHNIASKRRCTPSALDKNIVNIAVHAASISSDCVAERSVINIYYIPLTRIRSKSLDLISCAMQNEKIALKRSNTAAFEAQNILAILTACTEAALCFDVSNISERENRAMLTIAEAVLEISSSPYFSPSAWNAVATFCEMNACYFEPTAESLYTKLVEPAIAILDSEDIRLRLAGLRVLLLIADGKLAQVTSSENDGELMESIRGLKSEIRMFYALNSHSTECGGLLAHIKYCTTSLSKLASLGRVTSQNSFQRFLLVKLCLGALYVRLTAFWPALSKYLESLIQVQPEESNQLVDKVIRTDCICFNEEFGMDAGGKAPITLNTVIDDDDHNHEDLHWMYMDSLLNILASMDEETQTSLKIIDRFFEYASRANSLLPGIPRKNYDKCLVTWLRIISRALKRKSALRSDSFICILERMTGYENVDVATAALTCLERCNLSYFSAELIDYLRLLVNHTTFKATLTARPVCFDADAKADGVFFIDEKYRKKVVPILIGILQCHARRKDKKGIRSAALASISMFETHEILPLFARSLSGVVRISEDELHTHLLGSLLKQRSAAYTSSLHINLNSCSKTTVAFLLNSRTMMTVLRAHLRKCPDIFILVTFKIFALSVDQSSEGGSVGLLSGDTFDHRTKIIHRESALNIMIICEYFQGDIMPFWPIIIPALSKLGTRLESHVQQRVSTCLQIVHVLSAYPDLLFADEQGIGSLHSIITQCWRCLQVQDILPECRASIISILGNVVDFVGSSEPRIRSEALKLLRSDRQLVNYVLNLVNFDCTRRKHYKFGAEWSILERLVILTCEGDNLVSIIIRNIVSVIVSTSRVSDIVLQKLLGVLWAILSERRVERDICNDVMHQLAFLFGKIRRTHIRHALLGIFETVAAHQPRAIDVIHRLRNLNAMRTDKIDETDVTTRVQTYRGLTTDFFLEIAVDVYLVESLIRQSMYDLKGDDITIRIAARESLVNFACAVSKLIVPGEHESLLHVLQVAVNDSLPSLLSHRHLSTRLEGIMILNSFIALLPKIYQDLCQLRNHPLTKQFFENVGHIQERHQCEALRNLKRVLRVAEFSSRSMVTFVLPLLKGFLYSDSPDVVEIAISTSIETLHFITWDDYMVEVLKIINMRGVGSNAFEKYLCLALVNIAKVNTKCGVGSEIDQIEVVKELNPSVLPYLEARIVVHGRDEHQGKVNHLFTQAFCVISCLLEASDRDDRMRIVMSKLAHAFCSRSQKVRDSARRTLRCLLTSLPSSIIVQMLQFLMSQLDKGFTQYVRESIIFSAVFSDALLDADFQIVLPVVVNILERDSFGDLYGSMLCGSVKTFCAESRKMYPLRSTVLLFSRIYDDYTLNSAIRPLRNVLSVSSVSGLNATKLKLYLEALRQGLSTNTRLSAYSVLLIFFSVVSNCLNVVETKDVESNRSSKGMRDNSAAHVEKIKTIHTENINMLANFSLDILSDVLRRTSNANMGSFTKHMERSYFSILTSLLRYRDLQIRAITVLKDTVRHAPSTFQQHLVFISKLMFQLLKQSPTLMLRNAVYALLTAVLKSDHSLTLSSDLCNLVVTLTLEDTQRYQLSKANFSILKAVIGKRILVPHMYELLEKIISLNAVGNNVQLRASCSKLVVQFISVYPIGERKLHGILNSLLANADYEYAQGRLSVLATISTLVAKIPENILNIHSELLLFFFLAKLASDADQACRTLCAHSTLVLLQRVSDTRLNKLFTIIATAITGENGAIVGAALQILRISLPEIDLAAQIYIELRSEITKKIVSLSDCDGSAVEGDWPLLYNALLIFEQGCEQGIDGTLDSVQAFNLSRVFITLLNHPHVWIKTTICRLLNLCVIHKYTKNRTEVQYIINSFPSECIHDTLIGIVNVLWQLHTSSSFTKTSEKTMSSIQRTLTVISAHLIQQERSDFWQGNECSTEIFHLPLYGNFVTNKMHLLRMSMCRELQEFALKWMAALANEMKDVLKHYPEILRDFVAICRISRKGEKGIALLASDVIDCFSTYVPTQMWVQIISSVDDHHDPASYSTSLGKRNRKHI